MQRQLFNASLFELNVLYFQSPQQISQIQLIDQSEVTRSIDEVVNPLVLN